MGAFTSNMISVMAILLSAPCAWSQEVIGESIIPSTTTPTTTTAFIQSTNARSAETFYADFWIKTMDCVDPTLSITFEEIDFSNPSTESFNVYDNDGREIAECTGSKDANCGVFKTCLDNYPLDIDRIEAGAIYTITIKTPNTFSSYSCDYSFNAQITLNCGITPTESYNPEIFMDITPSIKEITTATASIQSINEKTAESLNAIFSVLTNDCIDPTISVSFEEIDYGAKSIEYFDVFDNDGTSIARCTGTQDSNCGVFQSCINDAPLNVDIIPAGSTYAIGIETNNYFDKLCESSGSPYSFNARVTLTCQLQADNQEIVTTTTEGPEVPLSEIDCCAKRCRKPWSSLSPTERNLYITAFKKLADQEVIQDLSQTHQSSAEHTNNSYQNPYFLPWHRAFIMMLEDEIRELGGDYACFGMPYWDWSNEATPEEVYHGEREILIVNSGLGADSDGSCQNSGSPFDLGEYIPQSPRYTNGKGTPCLFRDLDYTANWNAKIGRCLFASPDDIMELIGDRDSHGDFSYLLETRDSFHNEAHICIEGNMNTLYSPDDPIFYLHHTFIDYIWALWQDCHDYEGDKSGSSNIFSGSLTRRLKYEPHTADTYDIADIIDIEDKNIIYDKGPLFTNTIVDESDYCPGTVNPNWFRDLLGRTRRLLNGNGRRRRKRRRRERKRGTGIKKKIKFRPFCKLQQATRQRLGQEEELNIEVEECTDGRNACPIPDYFEDCTSMSDEQVNALTIEDITSMDGINDCQVAMRQQKYEFAKGMGYLRALCNGCMDPICDYSIYYDKCAAGNNNHYLEEAAQRNLPF